MDRDFAAVVFRDDGDNPIYCHALAFSATSGSVLLQMLSARSLRAEYRPASCTEPVLFVAPVTYQL